MKVVPGVAEENRVQPSVCSPPVDRVNVQIRTCSVSERPGSEKNQPVFEKVQWFRGAIEGEPDLPGRRRWCDRYEDAAAANPGHHDDGGGERQAPDHRNLVGRSPSGDEERRAEADSGKGGEPKRDSASIERSSQGSPPKKIAASGARTRRTMASRYVACFTSRRIVCAPGKSGTGKRSVARSGAKCRRGNTPRAPPIALKTRRDPSGRGFSIVNRDYGRPETVRLSHEHHSESARTPQPAKTRARRTTRSRAMIGTALQVREKKERGHSRGDSEGQQSLSRQPSGREHHQERNREGKGIAALPQSASDRVEDCRGVVPLNSETWP